MIANIRIKDFIKKILFRYTKLGSPVYNYNLDPIQLAEIVNSLNKVQNIEGNICEIGVARGMTTRFICEHIKDLEKKPKFYCLDTFSSFTKKDIEYEIKERKKTKSELIGFSYNDFEKWKNNFKNYDFVEAIQTDVKQFDFEKIKPIKFAILDVDLYLPTLSALKKLKNVMCKDGIIMVDDISKNNSWDGANQAFYEFVESHSLSYEILGKKCGVIKFK